MSSLHHFFLQDLFTPLTSSLHPPDLQLLFEGKAKAHWEVRQGRSKTDYRANETYINQTLTLWGSGKCNEQGLYQVGLGQLFRGFGGFCQHLGVFVSF